MPDVATAPRVPANARGVVCTSTFWATRQGREEREWRAGWWDACDGKPGPSQAGEQYALGRSEWEQQFAPRRGAGRNDSMTTTHELTAPATTARRADIPVDALHPHPANPPKVEGDSTADLEA